MGLGKEIITPTEITLSQWNNHDACGMPDCHICKLYVNDFSWEAIDLELDSVRSQINKADAEIKRQILRSDKKTKEILQLWKAFQTIKKDAERCFSIGRKISPKALIRAINRILNLTENAADIRAVYESSNEESFPQEFVKELIDSDNKLPIWREYRKLTQRQLAEKSGISHGLIIQIENGQMTSSVKTLKALALALDCDIEDIM